MEQRVKARFVRMSPSKLNIVAKTLRRKRVDEALNLLRFIPKAASPILTRLLKSAVAAAGKHPEVDLSALFIKELRADKGPLMRQARRFIPRAMGRASRIHKLTSHLTLVVSDGKTESTSLQA